jgi:outer membrane protein OmpA-like peptidoglycan-associated protein
MKKLLAASLAAFALASCADLSKYTKQATELVSTFSPQLAALVKQGQALLDRATAVPSSVPGAGDVVKQVAANQGQLKGLQSALDGLPGAIEAAKKDGNVAALDGLVADQQKATASVPAAADKVKALGAEVSALEARAAEARAAAEAAAEAARPYAKTLGTGYALAGNPGGVEAQLVSFLEDASKPVDKTTWFNFDRVVFKTGSAVIDHDASKAQLTNLAEILKAFPKAKLKLGGYTDNVGKPAANKKLSADRAAALARALTGLGVKAARLDSEGFGQEFPVCAANDSDDCRGKNRRVAVRVTAK